MAREQQAGRKPSSVQAALLRSGCMKEIFFSPIQASTPAPTPKGHCIRGPMQGVCAVSLHPLLCLNVHRGGLRGLPIPRLRSPSPDTVCPMWPQAAMAVPAGGRRKSVLLVRNELQVWCPSACPSSDPETCCAPSSLIQVGLHRLPSFSCLDPALVGGGGPEPSPTGTSRAGSDRWPLGQAVRTSPGGLGRCHPFLPRTPTGNSRRQKQGSPRAIHRAMQKTQLGGRRWALLLS